VRHEPAEHRSTQARGAEGRAHAAEIRRLARPFWAAVIIGAASLMAFVTLMSFVLDRNSLEHSQQVFSAMLGDRAERLAELTLEYGYWNEAVEHLVGTVDMAWVEETFVDYMLDDLQIEGVHLLDGADRPKLHVVKGAVAEADLRERYGPSVDTLVADARRTAANAAPVPARGLIGAFPRLYIATAVLMTSYTADRDISSDHVLVFARSVDTALLEDMSGKYRLPGLEMSQTPPAFWQAGQEIDTVDGNKAGYFVWSPELDGLRILPLLVIGVLTVYMGMLLAARMFFHRATETVQALEEAKLVAERTRELLAAQVRSDPLTGLGNRRLLDEKLGSLQDVGPKAHGHALLYVDLDRFKEINDTYGHETGDRVLRHTGNALAGLAAEEDTVVRLGGDEFVIVFAETGRERVLAAGRAIIDTLSKPVKIDGASYSFGASVGIAFARNPSDLLRQADVALYSAKRRGKAQMAIYSADLLDVREVVAPSVNLSR
jgi:diguanylate cyclase (GGDEF)-like protein